MREPSSVAVLGAGIAGATAARRLAEAGHPVRVFDKGRGVGGRMATRRVGAMQFDHGAQFMRAHGPAFAARLDGWQARGVSAPWGGDGRQVGVPGMTAPVRDLLAGLPVASETTIVRLDRGAEGWRLADGTGTSHGPFAAVAVTFPVPQVTALLGASGLARPSGAFAAVEGARYAPCWSLMLALDEAPPLSDPIAAWPDGPLALAARDSGKPGRPDGHRLVVHASPTWSRAHLEETREDVAPLLVRALGERFGVPLTPSHAAAHRWRYAQVEEALGTPCLYDPALRLGAAGDWCLGPRIEAAHDSGLALAEAMLAHLGAPA